MDRKTTAFFRQSTKNRKKYILGLIVDKNVVENVLEGELIIIHDRHVQKNPDNITDCIKDSNLNLKLIIKFCTLEGFKAT